MSFATSRFAGNVEFSISQTLPLRLSEQQARTCLTCIVPAAWHAWQRGSPYSVHVFEIHHSSKRSRRVAREVNRLASGKRSPGLAACASHKSREIIFRNTSRPLERQGAWA